MSSGRQTPRDVTRQQLTLTFFCLQYCVTSLAYTIHVFLMPVRMIYFVEAFASSTMHMWKCSTDMNVYTHMYVHVILLLHVPFTKFTGNCGTIRERHGLTTCGTRWCTKPNKRSKYTYLHGLKTWTKSTDTSICTLSSGMSTSTNCNNERLIHSVVITCATNTFESHTATIAKLMRTQG